MYEEEFYEETHVERLGNQELTKRKPPGSSPSGRPLNNSSFD
jgi:hypothetical protein